MNRNFAKFTELTRQSLWLARTIINDVDSSEAEKNTCEEFIKMMEEGHVLEDSSIIYCGYVFNDLSE